MKSSKRIIVFLVTVVVAGAAVGILLHAQSQDNLRPPSQAPTSANQKQLDDPATPIVDLADISSIDTKRWWKNSRYDRRRLVKTELDPRVFEVVTEARHLVSDLPAESDLIIVGRPTASFAYLPNDKASVYSEFTVEVIEVSKSRTRWQSPLEAQ